jgi:hypothetical protein
MPADQFRRACRPRRGQRFGGRASAAEQCVAHASSMLAARRMPLLSPGVPSCLLASEQQGRSCTYCLCWLYRRMYWLMSCIFSCGIGQAATCCGAERRSRSAQLATPPARDGRQAGRAVAAGGQSAGGLTWPRLEGASAAVFHQQLQSRPAVP